MKSLKTLVFRATCQTRRLSRSGNREVPYAYADFTLKKIDLAAIGWVCTQETTTYFATIASPYDYCDIKKVGEGRHAIKREKGIHCIKFQEHGTVRFGTYGLGHFDFMDKFEETTAEFFPAADLLRFFYPPGLKRFQSGFFR